MRRGGCPKKIVYSGNVEIRRFKGREGRGLIVEMIGKSTGQVVGERKSGGSMNS